MKHKDLYFCDPLTRPCRNLSSCYINDGSCRTTTNSECAKMDKAGCPILVMSSLAQDAYTAEHGEDALAKEIGKRMDKIAEFFN